MGPKIEATPFAMGWLRFSLSAYSVFILFFDKTIYFLAVRIVPDEALYAANNGYIFARKATKNGAILTAKK